MHRGSVPGPESFFTSGALPFTILVFALFHLLDVVKPWPVAQSQGLPGGWGITVDDVLTALYVAALSLFLIP
jgi:phosphatidylglycerophosphatase A